MSRVRLLAPILAMAALVAVLSAAIAIGSRPPERAAPPPVLAGAPSPVVADPSVEDEIGNDVAIEDPSGHALDALYAALRRAERGEGTARLLFYGGSHTAGDMYTGRMRELLQARFGDAGHGFVPLVPVVVDQWAWGIRIDAAEGWSVTQVGRKEASVARYGLAGVEFTADEPGAFAAVTSDFWGSGREASRLTLLYDRRPGGGTFEVWLDGARADVIEAAADPAAGGARLYRVSDGPHRLEVRARGDGPVTVYGVVLERDRPGVVVENLGLVGAKARHQLYWDEDLWRGFFVARRPDLVAFAYGNNEVDDDHLTLAQHEQHLRAVLARIRAAAPDASCLLIGPTDRPRREPDGSLRAQPIVGEISEMQRRVASDVGCAFFDTLAFQGGLGSGIRWLAHDPPLMRDDLMHLSHDSYIRWSEVLTRAMLARYDD